MIFCFLLLGCYSFSHGDDPELEKNTKKKYTGIALAGHASTNGFGGSLVYIVNKKFMVRGEYEKLKFIYDLDFTENNICYDASLHYRTGSISILGDYYLFKKVYLTGGFGYHLMNSVFSGKATSNLNYGDIQIPPDKIGDFTFQVKPGFPLSPYTGIGFGRHAGWNNRVAVNLELGAYYMGKQEVFLDASGLLAPTADPDHGQKELFENQLKRYRIYPVLRCGISFILLKRD